MKRNIYISILFVITLLQVACGTEELEKEQEVKENSDTCNCNDVFLDPDFGHFYTEKRDEPFNGVCESYHASGALAATKKYVEGKLDGEYFEYHPNGELKSEWNFLKNRQHGDYKGYDANGNLLYHSVFYKGDHDTTLYP